MAFRTIIRNGHMYVVKGHWKKKSIIILFVIIVMLTAGTYAWFASTSSDESDTLTAGRVAISMVNTLHTTQNVLPGEDVEGNLSITNTSDVNIYLRVKITVDTAGFFNGGDTFDTFFDLSLGSNWVKKGNWYYYKGLLSSGTNLDNIITHFSVRGTVGNDYQGKSFAVNAVSDSIQGTASALDGTWILSGDIIESDKTELNY